MTQSSYKIGAHKIKIFRQCRSGSHDTCPVSLMVEPSLSGPEGERIPSGRHVRIYCECPCHAKVPESPKNRSK